MMSDSDFEEEEKSPNKKVPKKLPKAKKLRLDSAQHHHLNHGQLIKYWISLTWDDFKILGQDLIENF
jgi:hypothetical protein